MLFPDDERIGGLRESLLQDDQVRRDRIRRRRLLGTRGAMIAIRKAAGPFARDVGECPSDWQGGRCELDQLSVHRGGPDSGSCGLSGDVRGGQLGGSGVGREPATRGGVGHVTKRPPGARDRDEHFGGGGNVIHPHKVIERRQATNRRTIMDTTIQNDTKVQLSA
jgi:hypothetical protein